MSLSAYYFDTDIPLTTNNRNKRDSQLQNSTTNDFLTSNMNYGGYGGYGRGGSGGRYGRGYEGRPENPYSSQNQQRYNPYSSRSRRRNNPYSLYNRRRNSYGYYSDPNDSDDYEDADDMSAYGSDIPDTGGYHPSRNHPDFWDDGGRRMSLTERNLERLPQSRWNYRQGGWTNGRERGISWDEYAGTWDGRDEGWEGMNDEEEWDEDGYWEG
jgi:hypothetical protein